MKKYTIDLGEGNFYIGGGEVERGVPNSSRELAPWDTEIKGEAEAFLRFIKKRYPSCDSATIIEIEGEK